MQTRSIRQGWMVGLSSLLLLLTVQVGVVSADPTFGVMNAQGGIYWRSAPDWNTPVQVTGFGFYPDTIISVQCYQAGAGNVPGSADYMWEQASVVGGSGYGSGWINEHFINDGQPINVPSPGVPPCGGTPAPIPAPPPPLGSSPGAPASGRVFGIVNADEGIYYRESPRWGDTKRLPGVGVYSGDRVELICGAPGDPVGPYSNTAWSKVRNLTRPSIGEGWVNEHFINDGAASNGWPSGLGPCGGTSTSPPPSTGPRSVFFSPTYDLPNGIEGLGAIADLNIPAAMWASGDCSTDGATNIPRGVETLAGWSKGRLGPIYVLAGDPRRWGEVHRIVLFDPGSFDNMSGCDKAMNSPSIGYLLAEWLSSNASNHLEVYTGHDTEEAAEGAGRYRFGGLWHYYFPQIWNQPFAGQVKVCDYPDAGHAAILEKLRWEVLEPAAGCKPVPGLNKPIPWHP